MMKPWNERFGFTNVHMAINPMPLSKNKHLV